VIEPELRTKIRRLFFAEHWRVGTNAVELQLRRHVATIRPAPRSEAYLRLQTLPGEQAQVDWGHFGTIRVGNAKRPLSCFVMVLSWSRAMFARFALDQTLESFLRGHVEAFTAFDGAPRSILYDNLKSVVLERAGDHVRFNEVHSLPHLGRGRHRHDQSSYIRFRTWGRGHSCSPAAPAACGEPSCGSKHRSRPRAVR
jgi:transposase